MKNLRWRTLILIVVFGIFLPGVVAYSAYDWRENINVAALIVAACGAVFYVSLNWIGQITVLRKLREVLSQYEN